ncbi:MAG: hypothetical protein ABI548_10315 [Polyangiaceae bacterium]
MGIVTDGTYVYWSGSDSAGKTFYVARRRVDQSDEVKMIATAETRAEGLALSSSKVFWLGDGHLRACDAPDCNNGPSDFEPTARNCFHVASIATALFWSCQTDYAKNNGSLWSVSNSGSTPVNLEPTSKNPTEFTSDGENIYWLNSTGFNSQNGLDAEGAVWRLELGTGATTKLVSGLMQEMSQIAVGGGKLYFKEAEAEAIYAIPLPNGALDPVKIADNRVGEMVADESDLYWADYYGGRILRCSHAGCATPEVIAPGQNLPNALAQDAVSIYWLGGNPGAAPVQRIAK